ncbi:DUF262 domain-containing protein [Propionibacteriaceae bacterium Y1923]
MAENNSSSSGVPEIDSMDALLERTLTSSEIDDQVETSGHTVAVTFSSQDFPVDGLVKRLEQGSMIVPQFGTRDERVTTAGFQRGFVWTKKQMDKFIESLLLGYPIPGIFLVKQVSDNRLLVLDGQQRLETLRRFYRGLDGDKAFRLQNVGAEFAGETYESLDEELRLKLDDSYMSATIVVADGSKEVNDAIYGIFERLNSGGTQLTPHEIRMALFAGALIDSIAVLNANPSWRALYGLPSRRARDHELILRSLALFECAEEYKRPLKSFLNEYVEDRRELNIADEEQGKAFVAACGALEDQVGTEAFRLDSKGAVNAAIAESVLSAVMHVMADSAPIPVDLERRVALLKEDEAFIRAVTRATADNDAVRIRLARARAFIC